MRRLNRKFLRLLNLQEVVEELDKESPYTAVYISGGHGAIIDLPSSLAVKKVIDSSVQNDKWMISICHGPAAFLAAVIKASQKNFHIRDTK